MCECQGKPLARVTLALGLPYLLVNRALQSSPPPEEIPIPSVGGSTDIFWMYTLYNDNIA